MRCEPQTPGEVLGVFPLDEEGEVFLMKFCVQGDLATTSGPGHALFLGLLILGSRGCVLRRVLQTKGTQRTRGL